jgi:hypothetical protein
MRWLLLLAVVACSHEETTPSPSSAPAPASAPASAPAIGHEGGEQMHMVARPPLDMASAVNAGSGKETPERTPPDWGDKGKAKASTVFKNLKVMGDVTGDRFLASMQGMGANLGEKCGLCHEMGKFDLDTKPAKERARDMLHLSFEVNRDYFRGHARVSCYTCHRGKAEPEKFDLAKLTIVQPDKPLPVLSEADQKKPAEQVYKNIQKMKGLPAGKVGFVMGLFSADLGVTCNFCHDTNDYASDDKREKKRAREMLDLVKSVDDTYFQHPLTDPKVQVSCWTCHRGAQEPPRMAQAPAAP